MFLLQYLDTCLSTFMFQVQRSRPEEFYIKGVLKNSTKFTGKRLNWGLFCNKAVGWSPATSLKTESGTDAFL